MRRYLKIYKKEMKSIADLALILIFFLVIIRLVSFAIIPCDYYIVRLEEGKFNLWYLRFIGYIIDAMVYIIPVMLVYSLNIDRISKSQYLALTLPFPKYSSMLFKFLAATSIGLILFFMDKVTVIVTTLLVPIKYWVWLKLNHDSIETIIMSKYPYMFERMIEPFLSLDSPLIKDRLWHGITVFFTKYFWFEFAGDLSQYMALCGMVCGAQGVTELVKKQRMLAWTVSFLLCLAIYAVCFEAMTQADIYKSGFSTGNYLTGYVTGYRFLVGAVTLAIGLFLYEKYAEV